MPGVAIITDTDCSIPLDLSKQLGIHQVPILVQFGEETFEAVFNLSDHEAYARINRENKLPTTSAPSPGSFLKAYEQALKAGASSIVCFTVSSEMSATYAAALSAAEMLPDKQITVMDTLNLTMGQGFIVMAGAEAAKTGASHEEVLAAASSVQARTFTYGALATLKYLAMSGRVGKLTAGMADVLNLKPILAVQAGQLEMVDRTRTRKKSWKSVIQHALDAIGGEQVERMSVIHVDAPEEALEFEELLREHIDCPEQIMHCEVTPGMSVHTGQGLIGVTMVLKEPETQEEG